MKISEIEEYRRSIEAIAAKIPAKKAGILVTGATGLIGSCLVDALLCCNRQFGAEYAVYVLGRSREKLESRFGNDASLHFLIQDIAQPLDPSLELDYIVHAASNADPRSYGKFPVETIMTNVAGARSILDYCKGKSTRALLTSTFEVYGKSDKDEFVEDDFGLIDQNQLRSCYPESKRVSEILFRAYHEEYGVDCVITRLSSVYGPTMLRQDNKAHAEFIRNAVNGEDIVLKSEGLQRRTYTYVMDVVSGLLFALFHGAAGEAYNIANYDAIASIAGLAELIAGLAGTKVIFKTMTEEEKKGYSKPQNTILRTDKINDLGWRGEYGLRRGLEETLRIYRQLIAD